MSAVAAPPEPGQTRRGARGRRASTARLGSLRLVASPSLYVLALLIGPVVLIGLYSVNLASNLKGVPLEFDLTNWDAFLFGADNPFRARLFDVAADHARRSRSARCSARIRWRTSSRSSPGATATRSCSLILAPFFTSYLLRIVAWQGILSNNGVVNSLLWELGLREQGSAIGGLIFSNFAVGLVLFYAWVPFVALPIFVVLDNMDRDLISAAHDLGAGPAVDVLARDAAAEPARASRRASCSC